MKKNKSFVPVNRPLVGKEELANVKKCIESGWISSSDQRTGNLCLCYGK